MKVKDSLRTLFRIRTPRKSLPPGPKPPVGSNIVRNGLRIRLKYPIDLELWEWLTLHGWRTIDMRTNRRRYLCVSEKALITLVYGSQEERNTLHDRLIQAAEGLPPDSLLASHRLNNSTLRNTTRLGNIDPD